MFMWKLAWAWQMQLAELGKMPCSYLEGADIGICKAFQGWYSYYRHSRKVLPYMQPPYLNAISKTLQGKVQDIVDHCTLFHFTPPNSNP